MQHNFTEDLARSQRDSRNQHWEEQYRKSFHGFVSSSLHDNDMTMQQQGIDRRILLESGRIVSIDEKFRERDFGDILLEEWSSEGKPGWIQKPLTIDYVSYCLKDSGKMYLLPFDRLQVVWNTHKETWKKLYRKVEAKNKGYTSVCWAIPTTTLFLAIAQTCIVS